MKTKRVVGQCVVKTPLHPEDVKVTIQQIPPGFVAPTLYQRLVAGARLGVIHEKLENWKVEVWDLPTRGRRNDLGRAAAAAR